MKRRLAYTLRVLNIPEIGRLLGQHLPWNEESRERRRAR